MAGSENAGLAAERFVQNVQNSYEEVMGHAVALGERNVLFARDTVGALTREYRQQSEANLALAQDLFERAEQQRDDFHTVVKESLEAYMGLLRTPLYRTAERVEAASELAGS